MTLRKLTVGEKLADRIFGYDYFISYAWVDARHYAQQLYERLQADGFSCFLDSEAYVKGDDWKHAGTRQLRKTTQLILVLTPGALTSQPVLREVRIFSKLNRRIVPIEMGPEVAGLIEQSALSSYLPRELLSIRERVEGEQQSPTNATIDSLKSSFRRLRQQDKRLRALTAIAVLMASLAVGATYFGFYAQQQRDLAEANLLHARSQQLAANSRLVRLQPPESATAALLLASEALDKRHLPNAFDAWVESAALLPPVSAVFRSDSPVEWSTYDPVSGTLLFVTQDAILYRWVWSNGTEPTFVRRISADLIPTRIGETLAFLGDDGALLGLDLSETKPAFRRLPTPGKPVAIAGESHGYFVATADGSVWQSATPDDDARLLYTSTDSISMIEVGPSQKTLVVATTSEIVAIDLESGFVRSRYGLDSRALDVSLDEDRGRFAAGLENGAILIADTTTTNVIRQLPHHRGRAVRHVSFLGDERLIYANHSGRVRIADINSGLVLRSYRHNGIVNTMQVTPNGEFLVVGCADGNTYIWNLTLDELVARPDLASPVSLAGYDTSNHALFHASSRVMVVRDMSKRRPFSRYRGTVPRVVSFASSQDGRVIAAAGGVGIIRIFPFGLDGPSQTINTGVGNLPISIALSPDGRRLAAATSEYVAIWEITDLSELLKIPTGSALPFTVALLDNAALVGRADGTVEMWNLESKTQYWSTQAGSPVLASSADAYEGVFAYASDHAIVIDPSGRTVFTRDVGQQVTAIALAPEENLLALGTQSGFVEVRNWRTGELKNTMRLGDEIRDLSFSSDSRHLAAAAGSFTSVTIAGKEMGYQIWNLDADRALTSLPHHGEVNAVHFLPDNRVMTDGDFGAIRVWSWLPEQLSAQVRKRVTRTLTEAERARYQ